MRVCLLMPCGPLLGKGWPLGSRLWCLLWRCHFPIGILGQVWAWLIDFWSLPSVLLSCNSSGQHPKIFYFMHNLVFEKSGILLFASLDCIILHINGKQFRCSVFTFVQYITNTGITDLNDIELFSQPLHIIEKLGQFMSILSTVILPRWKEPKISENSI